MERGVLKQRLLKFATSTSAFMKRKEDIYEDQI